MSDLFGTLGLASRSLDAQQRGIEATGQNIANVNTPGYTRRAVELQALGPADPSSAGRGVEATGVRAMRDLLLERRLQQELPTEQRDAAVAETVALAEASIGKPGESIDA